MAKRKAPKGEQRKSKDALRKEAAERQFRERIEEDLQVDLLRFYMKQRIEEQSRERRERDEQQEQKVREEMETLSETPHLLELLLPPGSKKH